MHVKEDGLCWSRDAHPCVRAQVRPPISTSARKLMKTIYVKMHVHVLSLAKATWSSCSAFASSSLQGCMIDDL